MAMLIGVRQRVNEFWFGHVHQSRMFVGWMLFWLSVGSVKALKECFDIIADMLLNLRSFTS